MDLELMAEEDFQGEDMFGLNGFVDDYSFCDGERCGICMDVVIDRGVLDCCQHWFCFSCIDNWATITSLCPLCQNEFQLITCVPVVDTIGSNKTEGEAHSRDNDWCIEGKSNTLSFPSYYIDETAVLCLDGDDCKIRSKSAAFKEDPNLDTSIACDSCDIWYHAFCVGFDAEGTLEDSWLCPRCVLDDTPKRLDQLPALETTNHVTEYISNSYESSVGAVFSGKMIVSIADAGETAVVISMVDKRNGGEESNEIFSSVLEDGKEMQTEKLILDPSFKNPNLEEPSRGEIDQELQEQELSSCRETSPGLSSSSLVLSELKTNPAEKEKLKNHDLDRPLDNERLEPTSNLHLGLSMGRSLHGSGNLTDKMEIIHVKSLSKRKEADCSTKDGELKMDAAARVSVKKIKKDEKSVLLHAKDPNGDSGSIASETVPRVVAATKDDDKLRGQHGKGTCTNAMNIFQGSVHRPFNRLATNHLGSMKESESAAGLRVKKIMRRATDKESLQIQSLRKEIREAIHNRSSEEYEGKLFNPKLLAAFRASIAKPVSETKKSSPLVPKAKGAPSQMGKIRENLTKKIYGTGGRRRRDWARDREIEFWKGRCLRTMKPEKVETLQSVLDLLKTNSDAAETTSKDECGTSSSILSRLYLADASVFPRKDDIKPLSAMADSELHGRSKEQISEVSNSSLQNNFTQSPRKNEVSVSAVLSSFNNSGNGTLASKRCEPLSTKMHKNDSREGASFSQCSSKLNSQKNVAGKSDVKSDKRRWASDFLAKKMATSGTDATDEKQQDNALLKGNYPLLAQLPVDMRPVLAPSCHNKIPPSIRQAQLYRLAELFLRKANIPVVYRTAETELAVADAVNIEKAIAERSKTKLVYINLCSQEVLHRSQNKSARALDPIPSASSVGCTSKSEEEKTNLVSDMEVDEALKNAGLLSDSPPRSPTQKINEINSDDSLEQIGNERPDSVLEINSGQERYIYGDFEYNLDDDEVIDATALKVPELQPKGELKMRMFISSSDPSKSIGSLDKEETIVDMPNVSSTSIECSGDKNSNLVDIRTNNSDTENAPLNGDEDAALAYSGELCGPDEEPLIERCPESPLTQPNELIATNTDPGKKEDSENRDAGQASKPKTESHQLDDIKPTSAIHDPSFTKNLSRSAQTNGNQLGKDKIPKADSKKQLDRCGSVFKKVEAYVKEHIRPLCKSGVITVEQYRWAVVKTADKVMKYHSKDKNANFLIKEGEKVKRLAEQYVEAAPQMGNVG